MSAKAHMNLGFSYSQSKDIDKDSDHAQGFFPAILGKSPTKIRKK